MAPAIIKEYLQLHSRLMFMMVKTKEFTPGRFDAASNLFLALGKKFFSLKQKLNRKATRAAFLFSKQSNFFLWLKSSQTTACL